MSRSIPDSLRQLTGSVAIAALAILISTMLAPPVFAHAFGQRYDLPLPLWLYISGAGAAVALSFVIMALFLHRSNAEPEAARIDLFRVPGFQWAGHRIFPVTAEAAAAAVFLLILAACFLGDPRPFNNIAPTFVWVVWWVGLAFFSALVANLWDLVNPWRVMFDWADRLAGPFRPLLPYPSRSGSWPAVVLFLCFAWMELISEFAEKPLNLGYVIVAYSAITWTGMAVFGRANWLRQGEVFSVTFGLLARFAPFAGSGGQLRLRFPSAGLLVRDPVSVSYACFVLLLLTSVTFDGILETPLWKSFLAWIAESQALRGTLVALQQAGTDLLSLIESIALLFLPLVFTAAFVATSWLVGRAGGGQMPLGRVMGFFVLSLVPIAIAYHLSHYLSYLLIAGQNIIPLVSDPFGYGWDLFGTRAYRLDLGIVNAKMVWYVSVTAIVVGHVSAVYLAHLTALRVFPTVRQALISQLPMMMLMVGYTMISLWILSQPIIA